MLAKQRAKQIVRRTIGEPYVGKRLKLRFMNALLRSLDLQPTAILDAGAEDATFVYWLADLYPRASVTAVDIDAVAMSACRAARPRRYAERVEFVTETFSGLADDSFDLITAFDVLEHIENDRGAVADLARSLRPGGTILVHVPRNQWTTRSGIVHSVPDAEAWRINDGHVRHGYSVDGLRELLAGAGLLVEDIQLRLGPWGVLAFSVYGRLEHPSLRLLTLPVTDVCAFLDRRPSPDGNAVFARARKPAVSAPPR
jgi:SAM-dependent methyltransferase